jgi:hypothetical protein
MGDHRQGHGRAHAAADLEGRADRHAVHRAVTDHRGRGRQAHLGDPAVVLLAAVGRLADRQQTFHQMGQQEAGHEQQEGRRYAEHLGARRLQRLRQQVQAHHAQHQAAGQAEDEVTAVRHALCRPAAGQRHQERAERDEHRHGPFVSDQAPCAHIQLPCESP